MILFLVHISFCSCTVPSCGILGSYVWMKCFSIRYFKIIFLAAIVHCMKESCKWMSDTSLSYELDKAVWSPAFNHFIANWDWMHYRSSHPKWQELNQIDNTNSKSALTKHFKQMDGRSCNKCNDNNSETSSWKHQETSRRELVDESSTVMCASKSIHGIPRSGKLSQLLVT